MYNHWRGLCKFNGVGFCKNLLAIDDDDVVIVSAFSKLMDVSLNIFVAILVSIIVRALVAALARASFDVGKFIVEEANWRLQKEKLTHEGQSIILVT